MRRALTPTSPSIARRLAAARRLRDAGVFVQLAVSPMMPNHPARLAELADGAADRVVVDTYFDGDGSGGRRSRALGMDELYARLGYEGWFQPGAERELMAAMRARLGAGRVLFSRAGFNDRVALTSRTLPAEHHLWHNDGCRGDRRSHPDRETHRWTMEFFCRFEILRNGNAR